MRNVVVGLVAGLSMVAAWGCSGPAQPEPWRAPPGEAGVVHPLVFDGGVSPAAHDFVIVIANVVDKNGLECNANLIAPNLLVTARHCVANLTGTQSCTPSGTQPTHFKTDFAPDHFSFSRDAYRQKPIAVHATQLIVPPGRSLCAADIAFVVLDKPITDIAPASVATAAPVVGDSLTVIGTGEVDSQGDFPDARQERSGVIITSVGPVDLHDGGPETAISVGEVATTPAFCHGDSGGAALSTRGELVALVSRTADCVNGPDVLTTVSAHADLLAQARAAASPQATADAGAGADAGSPVDPVSKSSAGCAVGSHTDDDRILAILWLSALLAAAVYRRTRKAV